MNSKGKVLGGQQNFGRWPWKSHSPNFDIFMNSNFNLTGVPSGKYAIECIVRDKNRTKRATVRKTIEIR
jgi:hypothetical protein